MLTAAHCLWSRRTARWLPASSLHFLAGYSRAAYAAHAGIAAYRLAPGIAVDAQGKPRDPATDWALLTLAADPGDRIGILPVAEPGDPALREALRPGAPLIQAGYDRTRAHLLSRRAGCRLVALDPGRALLLHGCATPQGSSGAPLLIEQAGRYLLAALHVGSVSRGGEALGLAILPPAASARQAAAAPAGSGPDPGRRSPER